VPESEPSSFLVLGLFCFPISFGNLLLLVEEKSGETLNSTVERQYLSKVMGIDTLLFPSL
jgi:hypothetical protein